MRKWYILFLAGIFIVSCKSFEKRLTEEVWIADSVIFNRNKIEVMVNTLVFDKNHTCKLPTPINLERRKKFWTEWDIIKNLGKNKAEIDINCPGYSPFDRTFVIEVDDDNRKMTMLSDSTQFYCSRFIDIGVLFEVTQNP